ncbi:ATP-dependent DNA/RNA helicase DHX36 [Varanus komodoensis]|nr:ATP-dependent DNA/RNA helicase DHX36 [Varanus komodoensis]
MSYEHRRDWSRGAGSRTSQSSSSSSSSASSCRGGGRGGGRGRPPPHLKGREIGLWYARRQGEKSKETERQQRAVVRMDERREEQIVQLLNTVQNKNEKEQEAMSWWSDEEGYTKEAPAKSKPVVVEKPVMEKTPERTKPILEKTFQDKDLEYLLQESKPDTDLDEQLKEELKRKKSDSRYIDMQRFREKLPSYGMRKVAERVAAERAEVCGNGKSTGYQIRLERQLSSVSHIILDEIHERNLQSDVLMTIIKDLLSIRLDLKVILMSATLNAEKFSEYFDNCPMIHIPGFTYPVKEYLLEDVIEKLRYTPENTDRRSHWKKRFMQGRISRPEKEEKEEIYQDQWPDYLKQLKGRYSESTIDALEMMDDDKIDLDLIAALIRYIVLEEEVFKKTPPGVRKIVIATNIAETSITIDDVVYVIDGGKIKETHFDTQNNISTMAAEWVSKANSKQRKGRAGRVQPGHCYHLYNGLRASLLDDYQLPEILRTPLEELCLQIKILKLGLIANFLSKLMDPPSRDAVMLSIQHLKQLNALDRQEELTPLGVHLARLPVEPHIGKMILFGALFCCLDPVLTIAASLSFKDPFFIPLGKEKVADARRKELSKNSKSDHLTVVNAFKGWEEAQRRGFRCEKDYCWDYFLSSNTLQMLRNMKGQFAEHLLAAGFVSSRSPKDPKSNINSDNEKLLKAVICAGLYPKVAKIRANFSKKRKMVKVSTKTDGTVCIHPKSVNVEETEFHYNWLVYHLKMRTTSIYLYDCTEVSPYCLLFFGGDISIQKDKDQDTIAVDEWIVFQSPARIAQLVKDLKQELDDLLQEKIENPQPVDWNNTKSRDTAVLTAIIDLITTQENETARNYAPRFQNEQYS